MKPFGITERGDGGLDQSWIKKADKYDGIICITKSPQLLTNLLFLPDNVIIHCTITGLGQTKLESGVAPTEITIPAYKELVSKYGSERVVLRIDPIIPFGDYLEKTIEVFTHAEGRVRISFIDNYYAIQNSIKLPWETLHAPLEIRKQALEHFPNAEICGEPDLPSTGCISERDYIAIGLPKPIGLGKSKQRTYCNCLETKKELLKNKTVCEHNCSYCYWRKQPS